MGPLSTQAVDIDARKILPIVELGRRVDLGRASRQRPRQPRLRRAGSPRHIMVYEASAAIMGEPIGESALLGHQLRKSMLAHAGSHEYHFVQFACAAPA